MEWKIPETQQPSGEGEPLSDLAPLVLGDKSRTGGKDRGRVGEGVLINFTLRNKSRAKDLLAFPVTFSKGLRDPQRGWEEGRRDQLLSGTFVTCCFDGNLPVFPRGNQPKEGGPGSLCWGQKEGKSASTPSYARA